jgi:ankyrin repeat protein
MKTFCFREKKNLMAKLYNYSNKILFFIFQSELVSWLAEEMSQQGLDVDQLDIASNSPLHLAAKHGCTTSAAALLHFGTQVTLKVTYFICFI